MPLSELEVEKEGVEMFDLAVLANPARLKREFLATTEVAPQVVPAELQAEFDRLQRM